ncbi:MULTISPECIES: transcription termination factor Rho [unclassified Nocardioides]|uniref:transcription termination factor Rho n=1 Tax=unclassified Nocardioides TaxID=2615069 RepID=UPI0009EFABD2|nr:MULTISPECIES: transcription termination factor Rho [unclassified Nocardioides]GAW50541.1 transcription termination factor Rho [Nocardioides sp. PD653-B2]GAW56665.1 transcription termination factor Rho [Nocardioides sp. PD653]
MTETIDSTTDAPSSGKKRGGGLNSMLIADLKAMAGGMGIPGSGSMKKAQLIEAIKAGQSSRGATKGPDSGAAESQDKPRAKAPAKSQDKPREKASEKAPEKAPEKARDAAPEQAPEQAPDASQERTRTRTRDQGGNPNRDHQATRNQDRARDNQAGNQDRDQQASRNRDNQQHRDSQQNRDNQNRDNQNRDNQNRDNQNRDNQNRDNQQHRDQQHRERDIQGGNQQDQGDEGDGSRRNRRRRGRDRDRTGVRPAGTSGGSQRNEPDTTILEDDVLVPAAGILDVLDNYAFVRTSGYLPGTEDVYVSLSMVRKFGLRRGDAIVGQVRQPREGERKEKFNPMVRIDGVNGAEPEASKNRVEFSKLTPLYPTERLRLETEPGNLIGRVIDIAAPIGKGQRGLIVSPSKAGKTMIMQSIANSITTNNPECHLMVVLVDERPEEVTDFERSVKGEVISSTFDRPASDHTMVAELAIERAKRLVELGHDVVVLLDGITRLGRAYNLAAPASGRILSGGVDSAALYPPKRFFGAARNIENGGSLTILATALIESGSKMDEVIFEEFKGTGNMEIRLRRDFADKRLFPAIDAVQSGTRREELLMSQEELAIVWKLRRVLSSLDGQQALELLLERLKKTQTNIEFLMQVQKTTPTPGARED